MRYKPVPKYKTTRINGKKKLLHRYIIEKHIGRELLSSELVHHKNRNTFDNRLENLQVMSLKEHNSIHMKDNYRLLRSQLPRKKKGNKYICPKCKLYKLKGDFPKNPSRSFGIGSYCKECQKLIYKKFYKQKKAEGYVRGKIGNKRMWKKSSVGVTEAG